MKKWMMALKAAIRRIATLTPNFLLMGLLTFLLSGCFLSRPNWTRFEELCAKPTGTINVPSIKAESFLEAAHGGVECDYLWEFLFDPGFSFYECNDIVHQPKKLYRYRLVPKVNGADCLALRYYYTTDAKLEQARAKWPRMDSQCLSKEIIETPKSRYVHEDQDGYVADDGALIYESYRQFTDRAGLITFFQDRLVDRRSGQVLSSANYYSYWQYGFQGPPYPSAIGCERITGHYVDSRRETLKVLNPSTTNLR